MTVKHSMVSSGPSDMVNGGSPGDMVTVLSG